MEKFEKPTVPSYFEYLFHRITVKIRKYEKPKEDEFSLELSKKMKYDQVVAKIAEKLQMDPLYIRLYPYDSYTDQPHRQPIKRADRLALPDMLVPYPHLWAQQPSDILYYEKLPISIVELESKKMLKISWHNQKGDEVKVLQLLVPKQATNKEVCDALKEELVKENIPFEESQQIRLLEVQNNKIQRKLEPEDKLQGNDSGTIRAEEISEEELRMTSEDKVIQCVHCTRDSAVNNFGNPFYIVIHSNELVSSVKKRIQKKLGITDEELAKWKFCIISYTRQTEYLDDDKVLVTAPMHYSDYLGMEHQDNTPHKHYRSLFEPKPVKIYN